MTKSPTARLLLGLLITLAAVMGFSWYALTQLSGLRKLQTETIDLNRHDSLLLLRVQNDVNTIGLKLRDMTQASRTRGIGRYQGQFARLREDLEEAVYADAQLTPATRRANKQAQLVNVLGQFWQTSDHVFKEAAAGEEDVSRTLISTQLSAQQALLATQVADLLQRNTEAEVRADQKVAAIYSGAEWKIYTFLAGTMVAIAATTLYLIYSNRRLFGRLESLSRQRRVLAAKLITVQEEVLRSVSRELHDEFGQILTAVSAMLARAERKGVPPDSPLRTELSEVRQITHHTLEKMRSLSQMLHPAVLDDYGLAKGIEWYTGVFERQTGVQTGITVTGEPVRITGQRAIHCFRIVQEALTNAAKHSGAKAAEVKMIFTEDTLSVSVKDFGRGIVYSRKSKKPGLGLIAMHERAELLAGKLNISSSAKAGTTISLAMPLRQEDQASEMTEEEETGELVGTNHE
jgi:signal transduction histidine kinase